MFYSPVLFCMLLYILYSYVRFLWSCIVMGMGRYGFVQSCLVPFDLVQSCLVIYGPKWSCDIYHESCMVLLCYIMVLYGFVWSCVNLLQLSTICAFFLYHFHTYRRLPILPQISSQRHFKLPAHLHNNNTPCLRSRGKRKTLDKEVNRRK